MNRNLGVFVLKYFSIGKLLLRMSSSDRSDLTSPHQVVPVPTDVTGKHNGLYHSKVAQWIYKSNNIL